MTSGGVLSQYDQATDDQFSPREITAMVDEARRAKRIVAAHAHSHGGIQNAIDCGAAQPPSALRPECELSTRACQWC